jgi:signal transduction histidine kinase
LSQLLSENYNSQVDNEGKEMLSLITKSRENLKKLIDGLLEYSRSENVLKENKSQINLNSLIDELTGLFVYEHNLTLKLESSITNIEMNRAALEQVLINLITNSIKYNDKKNVEIEIGVSESATHYEFYVQDNGLGIALENQEKIFEIFEVLGNEDRFGIKGNGIGLATVKKVIENSGGSIKVESEPTKGARFIFTFEK